jgi:hypothetical protein
MPPAAPHRHALGLTFVVQEPLARTWHALAHDGRVWLVDPIDGDDALAQAQGLGEVAGVVQLLDRHQRDGAALAERLGVPHHRLPDALPGTPFDVVRVLDLPFWRERALWSAEHRALVVAEVVGTAPMWAAGPPPAGVHPMVRALPPGDLGRFAPDLLLVGHGPPLEGPEAAGALHEALRRTRRDIPRLALRVPEMVRIGRSR